MSDRLREPVYGQQAELLAAQLQHPATALRAYLDHVLSCMGCRGGKGICAAAETLYEVARTRWVEKIPPLHLPVRPERI